MKNKKDGMWHWDCMLKVAMYDPIGVGPGVPGDYCMNAEQVLKF